ncbi:hypothetical protein Tco_1501631 [Tanacetum coccineum]
MSKVLQERGFGSVPSSTETNPRDQVKSISIAKANFSEICRIRCGPYAILSTQHRSIFSETVLFPRRLQNFGSLVDLGASVGVMPFSTYTNLGLGILSHTRYKYVNADLLPSLSINLMSKSFYYSIIKNKDEGKSHVGTLINIPVFVRSFSIITGFTIIDGDDIAKDVYSVLTDHLIRRIHQLDTTYQTFYPEQRIEFYSINDVSVLPNNMAYSMNSIRRTGIQQTYMAWCMTRSSTEELLSPFENPKQKFFSRRRLFDTPSLVESNSLEFDHIFYIEEQSGEEGQFLKELRDNTFSGSVHEDANEHIEKVLEIEPDESLFRAWERFKELLMKCPQHYLTDMQEVILFYNGLDVPTRQILDSKGAIPFKTAVDAKIAIQEMVGYELCKGPHYTKDCPQKEEGKTLEEAYYTQFGAPYQPGGQYRAAGPGFYQRNNGNSSYPDRRPSLEESLTKFMAESAKRHEENSNIIKEIRASTDAAIRNQGASIKTLEIQIGQMSKVLQERGFGSLPSSTETNPRDQVKSISTAKANFSEIRRIGCGPYLVSGTQHMSIFSETVPFLRRLQNFGCNDGREAQDVKILDAYDPTLP